MPRLFLEFPSSSESDGAVFLSLLVFEDVVEGQAWERRFLNLDAGAGADWGEGEGVDVDWLLGDWTSSISRVMALLFVVALEAIEC